MPGHTIPWTRTCYGIDLSAENPVIVKGTRSGSSVTFSTVTVGPADQSPLPDEDSAPVAGAMSARESFSRWLNAPFASISKASQVLPSLLDIQLPFPVEECVCRFFPVEREEDGTASALAVAARSIDIQKRLDAYAAIGTNPVVLDQEGVAAWTQSLHELAWTTDAVRIVVVLGGDRATVALGRGDRLISTHSVPAAPEQVERILSAQLTDKPTSIEWAWAGAGAEDTEAIDIFYRPLSANWPGKSLVHSDPRHFLARALATRALLPGPLRCNLRTGLYEHPALSRNRRRLSVRRAAGVLLACLAASIVSIAANVIAKSKADDLKSSYAAEVDRLAGRKVTHRGSDALPTVRTALEKRATLTAPFAEMFRPSQLRPLDIVIKTAREKGLTYQVVVLREGAITLSGTADTWEACEELETRLRRLSLNVGLERRKSASDNRISFSLTTRHVGTGALSKRHTL